MTVCMMVLPVSVDNAGGKRSKKFYRPQNRKQRSRRTPEERNELTPFRLGEYFLQAPYERVQRRIDVLEMLRIVEAG
jgi:hypothetical protein